MIFVLSIYSILKFMRKYILEKKWCDLFCENARFPEEDALSGACRTLSTLYCIKHDILVQKNSLCIDFGKYNKSFKQSQR
jgi:hypothetical protein